MPLYHCRRCGLIFAPETPADDTTTCTHCLSRIRRGRLSRSGFDRRDAPLFRALARERHPASDLRCFLGLPTVSGTIPTG